MKIWTFCSSLVNEPPLSVQDRFLYSQEVRRFSTCGGLNAKQTTVNETKPFKPDLKKAAQNNRPTQIIVGVCILVAIYMYPMIFRPLFGLTPRDDKDVEEKMKELAKKRPDFMPQWTSPFAPKGGDE